MGRDNTFLPLISLNALHPIGDVPCIRINKARLRLSSELDAWRSDSISVRAAEGVEFRL